MDVITTILSGFGLAAPAGLNAWLPLFITGLAQRFELIKLTSPFDLLGNTWVLVGLGESTSVSRVRVVWPSGNSEEWSSIAVDRYTTLKEGEGK